MKTVDDVLAALRLLGIDVDLKTLLIPTFCPKCSSNEIVNRGVAIVCTSGCGYTRPTKLEGPDLLILVVEAIHHVRNGTLRQRIDDAWRLK